MCHDKFAKMLVSNVNTNENIEVHDIDSDEFKQIIEDEFTGDETEELDK